MSYETPNMEMTPKNQLLSFFLERCRDVFVCVKSADVDPEEQETAILSLLSFIPSETARSELYNYYFTMRDKYTTRVAIIMTTGLAVQSVANTMDLVSTEAGSFI